MQPARGQRGYVPVERSIDDKRRYAVEVALREHVYDYTLKGSRPDDPGWNVCRCRQWEGYWCDFNGDHLAVEVLRALDAT